jgi:hypothetical protein
MLRVEGDGHDKFKKLCALAISGGLAPLEVSELQAHVQDCEGCREVLVQYESLSTQGMAVLADVYLQRTPSASWDDTETRRRLLSSVEAYQQALVARSSITTPVPVPVFRRDAIRRVARMAIAAGLICALAFGAYRVGLQKQTRAIVGLTVVPVDDRLQRLSDEKKAADETLAAQAKRLTQLQVEGSVKEQELAKLRLELRAAEEHSSELVAASNQSAVQLQNLSQQRDALNAQLQTLTQAYESEKAEFANLRSEREKTVLRTSTLEAKIEDLAATNRDQERRLKDAEQYLSSDRDIRDLMGARKLYIADVFDVDGTSRTQRPFGRVFYTQGKSLLFYAFDLDREPGVVNASTFQVWGQREAPQGEQATPMNLGILYRDDESNRRWVMRFDEPKQLAEIDAVFVTVEPRGGSHKPTSKPFLYALLRNEANHP